MTTDPNEQPKFRIAFDDDGNPVLEWTSRTFHYAEPTPPFRVDDTDEPTTYAVHPLNHLPLPEGVDALLVVAASTGGRRFFTVDLDRWVDEDDGHPVTQLSVHRLGGFNPKQVSYVLADDEDNRTVLGEVFAHIHTAANPFDYFDDEGDEVEALSDEPEGFPPAEKVSIAETSAGQSTVIPETVFPANAADALLDVDTTDEDRLDDEGNVVWPPTGIVEVEMDTTARIDAIDEPTSYVVHLLDPILQPTERGAFAALVVATSVSGNRLFTMATHEWEESGETCRRLAVYRLVENQWWRVFAVRADETHSAHALLGGFIEALGVDDPFAGLRESVRNGD